MTLGDRLIVMNAGRVEQIGTPLEVYGRPASTFVAGFIGSPAMNFLAARVGEDGATVAIEGAVLPLEAPRPAIAGQAVQVGLRPEHLAPVPPEAPGLDVTVDWFEALGADTVAHAKLADGSAVAARLDGSSRVRGGDRMRLGTSPERVHLFEVESGRRL